MKIYRLIGILTVLQRKEKATLQELADRFEVSCRTISRDIDALCLAGIPLMTTRGKGGGVAIAPGYQLDRALLNQDELEAIFAGLDGIDSVSSVPYSAALSEKLQNSGVPMDSAMRIRLFAFDKNPLTRKIETIRAAIQERRRISFHYYYSKGECDRTVEPYYLIYQWSAWYVWGYCLLREDFRTFKLDRLEELQITGERFEPEAVSPPWQDEDWYFAFPAFHLRARFSAQAKYRLIEEYGPNCFTQQGDCLLLERDFVSYDNMREWILSFGDQAEVLEPQTLRKDLRRQAENLFWRYLQT